MDEYQSQLGERAFKVVLEKIYNLELSKITERKGHKTPDYKIFNGNGNQIAICEVKSCVDTIRSEDLDLDIPFDKEQELAQKREKGHIAKLQRHHSKAMSQLSSNNEMSTIMLFASFDMTDGIDLQRVIDNHKRIFPDAQLADVYAVMKIHQSIIPSNTFTLKYSTNFYHSSERGKEFMEKNMNQSESWKKTGTLPLTFKPWSDEEFKILTNIS